MKKIIIIASIVAGTALLASCNKEDSSKNEAIIQNSIFSDKKDISSAD